MFCADFDVLPDTVSDTPDVSSSTQGTSFDTSLSRKNPDFPYIENNSDSGLSTSSCCRAGVDTDTQATSKWSGSDDICSRETAYRKFCRLSLRTYSTSLVRFFFLTSFFCSFASLYSCGVLFYSHCRCSKGRCVFPELTQYYARSVELRFDRQSLGHAHHRIKHKISCA